MPEATGANRKLFTAAKKGDAAGVRAALAAGADVTARDGNGWIALHEACRWCRLQAVQALLEAGSDPNRAHADFGYTPLFVATFTAGNAAIVRALLAAGAAPSLTTSSGMTALHNAAAEDLEALEALLAAGGDPDIGTSIIARAKPEHAQAVAALVACYASTPKQSAEAAAKIAAGTRAPDKPAPFTEAKPIVLGKIHLKGERTTVSEAELDELQKVVASQLPTGYRDLMLAHGPGIMAGKVRVYGPLSIAHAHDEWHSRLARYWFWGAGPLLTQAAAKQAVRIGDTLDGDELVFHPSAPDTLLVLPRESEEVVLASRAGLLPALARLLGRVPAKLSLEPLKDD